MAWRLHDTIYVDYLYMDKNQENQLTDLIGYANLIFAEDYANVELSFSDFNEKWFKSFMEILHKHCIEFKDEYKLYPIDRLNEFLENKEKDTTGLQEYLEYLNLYLNNVNYSKFKPCYLTFEFED